MAGNNIYEECGFSESEDELEFSLHENNLVEGDRDEDENGDTESDSDDSDIIVHRRRKVRGIESDTDGNASI